MNIKDLRLRLDHPLLYSTAIIILSILFAILFLGPFWASLDLHVPGEKWNKIDFTQPVDSIFYVRNAELGYRWGVSDPTSLWFHPLIAWCIQLVPISLPGNIKFWILSLISGLLASLAVYKFTNLITLTPLNPRMILLIPFIPGGIGIATGNAEIPCLLFTSLLGISVLTKQPLLYPLLFGSLSILTKPNALYMIPFLFTFATVQI
ncbi:MAG: hypothetical protein HXX14_20345 [Bacteroidetes bacterium]|uniref:Glycosyltransferase RgtA/B/C/D-like domain-containing protein n=1 Tax=Candidatus Chlorohelix allophototropha TaxID=3003348 RepID=A0ABY9BAZ8_9CHLR|nr:hypothetical protein [Bacteroidota bacterium]NWJ53204.1 hypothetical protein [Bacteroidota bacterium]WJW70315.1 hypothetical protein OZ401_005046 [Chloroflexota bacterium L227-S17]